MWIIWDAICLSHYTFNHILISLIVILDCLSLQYFLLFRNVDNNLLLQPEKMILAKSTHRWRSPSVSESRSVVSTLRPHGLYSPWNSLGQNTGVGSLPFSRGSSRSGDLPDPVIAPRSPALQADSLPAEPWGKPDSGIWLNTVKSVERLSSTEMDLVSF